jgi:hypothetical protein
VGRGPWPFAPLTVPLALVVATIATGLVSILVVAELPWSEGLDQPGATTVGLVFGISMAAALVLLSLTTRARPSLGRALVGVLLTGVAVALITLVANVIIGQSLGFPDPLLPDRDVLTDEPEAVLVPQQLLLTTYADFQTLDVTLLDHPYLLTVPLTFGLVMAAVGVGATLASAGTLRSALLAAIGAAAGAFVGEMILQYASFEWPEVVRGDLGLPRPFVLVPMVLSGIGLGLGALLGRPHGTRAAQPAGTASVAPGYVPPPPPGPAPAPTSVAPGYVPATGPQPAPPAPASQPAPQPPVAPEQPPVAPPPGAEEPPPGATSF